MAKTNSQNTPFIIAIILFLLLTIWWILLHFGILRGDFQNSLFGLGYGLLALFGAIYGLRISRNWGGMKSVFGKSVTLFSLGLLAQEFGQISYAYYVFYKHIEIPYPSIGDVGFFGSIPFYAYGALLLGQAAGVKFSLKSYVNKLQAIAIPLIILFSSYFIFLQGYKFDWSNPLTIFLDFGYPLGEAIYISFALLAFLLSRKILGGVMKYRVLFILCALLIQYLSDFAFLYQAKNGTFVAGGVVDLMYLISYFTMTLALLQLNIQSIQKNLDG